MDGRTDGRTDGRQLEMQPKYERCVAGRQAEAGRRAGGPVASSPSADLRHHKSSSLSSRVSRRPHTRPVSHSAPCTHTHTRLNSTAQNEEMLGQTDGQREGGRKADVDGQGLHKVTRREKERGVPPPPPLLAGQSVASWASVRRGAEEGGSRGGRARWMDGSLLADALRFGPAPTPSAPG